MINSTLMEQEVPAQKQKEFLAAQASQLDKLDFLMQAMIKTSRLETGVISLEQKQQPVYDTLAAALGGILLNAEKKQIDVQVEMCIRDRAYFQSIEVYFSVTMGDRRCNCNFLHFNHQSDQ